ncbi:hypothetical protein DID77_00685 [Candidatus Marinamargulisbacteria bacterium SCGC AG-439-L15]|nr:hypothetical protein DID77_00685 [Candidatus Marinamargulisbacteria bacterium SCGC AG-439-L15]
MKFMNRLAKKVVTICLYVIMASPFTYAQDQLVHVHGHATGVMLINGSYIDIELTIPALSVIGFEEISASKEDQAQIKQAIRQLSNASLFTFLKRKRLWEKHEEIASVIIENNVILNSVQPEKRSHKKSHHHHHEGAKKHADFKVKMKVQLKNIEMVDKVVSDLFLTVPDLEELHLTVISDSLQSYHVFTPKAAEIKWPLLQ